MKLIVILRNIELRIVEGYPVKDPLKPIRIANHRGKDDESLYQLIDAMETETFQTEVAQVKKDEGIEIAYMNRTVAETISEKALSRIEKALDKAKIKFEIIEGSYLLGGGGTYHQSIIFL